MKSIRALYAVVLIGLMATHVNAQVPNLLNYQGRLSDSSGNPQNGTFTMQFAVYDAETGGNQLPVATPWSETQSVTVTNGVFNVLLGSVTPLGSGVTLARLKFRAGRPARGSALRVAVEVFDGRAEGPLQVATKDGVVEITGRGRR